MRKFVRMTELAETVNLLRIYGRQKLSSLQTTLETAMATTV